MYKNLKIENAKTATDEIEIEGEVMLMHTEDYFPSALSAIAKIMRRAGKFVCQFEISSEAELFMTEASSPDFKSCIKHVERNMRRKIAQWNNLSRPRLANSF